MKSSRRRICAVLASVAVVAVLFGPQDARRENVVASHGEVRAGLLRNDACRHGFAAAPTCVSTPPAIRNGPAAPDGQPGRAKTHPCQTRQREAHEGASQSPVRWQDADKLEVDKVRRRR